MRAQTEKLRTHHIVLGLDHWLGRAVEPRGGRRWVAVLWYFVGWYTAFGHGVGFLRVGAAPNPVRVAAAAGVQDGAGEADHLIALLVRVPRPIQLSTHHVLLDHISHRCNLAAETVHTPSDVLPVRACMEQGLRQRETVRMQGLPTWDAAMHRGWITMLV